MTSLGICVDRRHLRAGRGALEETGEAELRRAMLGGGMIPAPVVVEFLRVMTKRGSRPAPAAEELLNNLLLNAELVISAFEPEDARIAAVANMEHGAGNGRGGRLNLIDLMVYAVARRLDRPILCTGTDFASTGIAIHPSSRGW